ncbi:hypothetical protein [Marinifilum caeruleilacunae]|uniref:Uncharacterized protein n=1 Tax=Marinifilum caeruleilacunae TaxID=2499076 RepID=A0ABX1X1S0_9BACT|nr:hypothetical protein [Marinifilum caeruleilacunae]NOU62358.1 hypothetical protein [Marinifilum caeruleilacunae]
MKKEDFIKQKENLLVFVTKVSKTKELKESDKISLVKLTAILNEYTFENRIEIKGLLSRIIIDSLELDYSIGEKFIEFDNNIR